MYDQYQEEEGGFPWGGAALGGAAALGLGGFSKVGRTGMRALGGAADTMGGNVGPMVGNSLRGMADMYERGGEKIGGGIRSAMGAFGGEFKNAYPQTFGPGGTVSNAKRTVTEAVADLNPQRAKELLAEKAAARETAKQAQTTKKESVGTLITRLGGKKDNGADRKRLGLNPKEAETLQIAIKQATGQKVKGGSTDKLGNEVFRNAFSKLTEKAKTDAFAASVLSEVKTAVEKNPALLA